MTNCLLIVISSSLIPVIDSASSSDLTTQSHMRDEKPPLQVAPFSQGLLASSSINATLLERFIVSKSLTTLTLGSSKINQHCWRFHGSGVIAAPQIIGLISFCTGMHHEYFFEVVNVLSCSPFMFENTENKQLDWRIHHSHLASTLFHSLVPWWRPRRIRPQITRLSQLENSAMGTWPIYKNSLYYTRLVRKMAW